MNSCSGARCCTPSWPISPSQRMAGVCSSWPRKFSTSFGGHGLRKIRIIDAVQTLQVDVGHSRYPIAIGPGLLTDGELLDAYIRGRDLLIVTNTTVAPLYLARLTGGLAAGRLANRRVAE